MTHFIELEWTEVTGGMQLEGKLSIFTHSMFFSQVLVNSLDWQEITERAEREVKDLLLRCVRNIDR